MDMSVSGVTNYLRNHFRIDNLRRGQAFTQLTNTFIALLTTTKGPRGNSTVYALNDTISVLANGASQVQLYKCTTAGTSAASQSTLYPGVSNEVITDGTAVFTEQDSALRAGLGGAVVEASYTSYARVSYAATLANWAGTQSAGSTTASTGTSGVSSNNNAITFASSPGSGPTLVWGFAEFDASTAGNMLDFAGMQVPKTLNSGDAAPSFAAAALTVTET